jgi:hypothetical protein
MTTYLGVLSISLLLLALAVRESLATPLTVVGLMGLVVLRLSAASGRWSLRRSIVRAGTNKGPRERTVSGLEDAVGDGRRAVTMLTRSSSKSILRPAPGKRAASASEWS